MQTRKSSWSCLLAMGQTRRGRSTGRFSSIHRCSCIHSLMVNLPSPKVNESSHCAHSRIWPVLTPISGIPANFPPPLVENYALTRGGGKLGKCPKSSKFFARCARKYKLFYNSYDVIIVFIVLARRRRNFFWHFFVAFTLENSKYSKFSPAAP